MPTPRGAAGLLRLRHSRGASGARVGPGSHCACAGGGGGGIMGAVSRARRGYKFQGKHEESALEKIFNRENCENREMLDLLCNRSDMARVYSPIVDKCQKIEMYTVCEYSFRDGLTGVKILITDI
eukprot:bmy_08026T0